MMISDLVADKEIDKDSVNLKKWCSCIDGALTKKSYLDSIRKARFKNVEVLEEKPYIDDQIDNADDEYKTRKISSLLVKAVKD